MADRLVWTEEERLRYFEEATKMGLPFPGEPLLSILVDATTLKTVEEAIKQDGKLTRIIIRFLPGHVGLVSLRPFINDKPLIKEGGLVGDDQIFELLQDVGVSKGDKAIVEIKNFDRHGHIPGIRFFMR